MQISDQVIEVLNYLCEKIGVTIDWTSANVLPYLTELCEKYVRYEIATSVVWIIAGVISCVISGLLIKKSITSCNGLCAVDDIRLTVIICCALSIVLASAVIICQALDIVECCTIPEKVLFDYIQTVISKNK